MVNYRNSIQGQKMYLLNYRLALGIKKPTVQAYVQTATFCSQERERMCVCARTHVIRDKDSLRLLKTSNGRKWSPKIILLVNGSNTRHACRSASSKLPVKWWYNIKRKAGHGNKTQGGQEKWWENNQQGHRVREANMVRAILEDWKLSQKRRTYY